MNIVIDLILFAVIAAGAIMGLCMGFIKIAAKPAKAVLALIIAFSLCSAVADSFVAPMIDEPVTNYVSNFLYEECGDITVENAEQKLPTLLKFAAGAVGVDVAEAAGEGDIIKNLVDVLIDPVIGIISVIFAFIGLYLLSKLLLSIAFAILGYMFQDGMLGALNKIIGVVFSTLAALLIAWGLAVILEFVFHSAVFESNQAIAEFEGGLLYKFFNKYNPIELLLSF